MPIRKETPTRLVKVGATYSVIPSHTIALVGDAVALGILVYLMDKPSDWIPRKKDICKALNIGSDRWENATKILSDLDLFMVTQIRDETGRFIDRVVTVSAVPMGLSPKSGKPDIGKTVIRKTAPIHITDTTHDIGVIGKGISGWAEWVEYRKEIKKKMTPATIKKQVKLLENKTPAEQQAIIDQSITNGWTGLFEVKNGNNGRTTQPNKNSRRLSPTERAVAAREAAYDRASTRSPDMGYVVNNDE